MESLNELLSSPAFSVGAIVLTLILGVVASYLRDFIDKLISSISSKWKQKSQESKQKKITLIKSVRDNNETKILLGFVEMRFRNRSQTMLLSGLVNLILVFQGQSTSAMEPFLPFLNIFGLICMLESGRQFMYAIKIKSILYSVEFNPRDYL